MRWAAAIALAATAAVGGRAVRQALVGPHPTSDYVASHWWLDYGHGFVRRGLPGQVLTWIVGGAPTADQVDVAAVAVTLVAVLALGFLTWSPMASLSAPLVPVSAPAVAVSALLLVSPFTFVMTAQEVGRYDAIGIAALAVLVAVRGRPVALAAVAATVVVAVLSEEFLIAFLAPVACLAVHRAELGRQQRLATAVAAVGPGLIAATVSLAVRPDPSGLRAALLAAHAARPDILLEGRSAIAVLMQTPYDSIAHLAQMSPWTLPALTGLYGGCYAAGVAALWHLLGRPRIGALVAWFALSAVGLSVLGIDYRRWWALAFVATVAVLVLRARRDPGPPPTRRVALLVGAVLAVSVLAQLGPMSAAGVDPHGGTTIHIRYPLWAG